MQVTPSIPSLGRLPFITSGTMCPALATVLINTYRQATELFVYGSTLFSEEGITQGDPLAMPMYMATIPFINQLEKD